MKKKNGVNHSTQIKVVVRRKSALDRLQTQLKVGYKTTKNGNVKLSEHDIKRINSEIAILQGRI